MNLVIDVSVAIKWFVKEILHEEADRLLGRADRLLGRKVSLHAPDILLIELANVAWKKTVRKEIDQQQAREIVRGCLDGVPILHPSADFIEHALEIGLTLNHPVYDCVYLACAEATDGILITADSRLLNGVKNTKFESVVIGLEQSGSLFLPLNIAADKLNELRKLSERMLATADHVRDAVASKGPIKVYNMKDMAPFADSPTRRRMYDFLNSLTEDERIDVLALMWLGQGASGNDWNEIRKRASEMIGSFAQDRYSYLISKVGHLEQGLQIFQELTSGAQQTP